MRFILQPWQLLLAILSGWIHHRQQKMIEFRNDQIQGALANVGYYISDTTVGNILTAHGIEPAPDRQRQTTWATFLKAHKVLSV